MMTLRLLLMIGMASSGLWGCLDDGYAPDCPSQDDYRDEDDDFDYPAWRKAAEKAGCMTPIGGHEPGQGGSSS